ncbi:enoyl-CoA hydratase-related protein [Streptomyces hygroscopicus]|uniref:enoyl-CoA hydratase-related protein n=1 Tax=Streptomyces hygroscopicus TaxID=1912 RepID=UPI000AF37472|nr:MULTISPECIES: enoyl-CoA hydratase-related protein [Streptomyces]
MTRGGSGMTAHETLSLAYDRGMLTVRLTRPERQNSITATLLAELGATLDLAERTEDCRLVVLEAEGGTFCSGMDLYDAAGTGAGGPDASRGGTEYYALLERLTSVGRIVVARVDGQVVGGGVGLVAACDFVYATGRSQFSLPEALWGLMPCSVLPFLIRRVGFQRAHTMALSTLPVGAVEAERCRLVDEVTEDAWPSLRRLLFRASRFDQAVVGGLKRYMRRLWIVDEGTREYAVGEFARLMSSDAVRRRIAEFASGRAATRFSADRP